MKEQARVAAMVVAVLLVCAGAGPGAAGTGAPGAASTAAGRQGAAPSAPVRSATGTVEPTLPLIMDMSFEDSERTGSGARGRLLLDLRAEGDISDLTLEIALPPDMLLQGDGDLPRVPVAMAHGERRRYAVGVVAGGPGRVVRIEARFLDESGRRLRLGQGATLAPNPVPGRSHLGAWEVMAVPMAEPPR